MITLEEEIMAFVAKRSSRLDQFDSEIRPIVVSSLSEWTSGGTWYADIVEGAGVLWLEIFEQHSKDGNPAGSIDYFNRTISEALAKTSQPSNPPTDGEINRVARWVGVYTVNHATYRASIEEGALEKRWVTMHDPDVRSMHSAVDGQTVPIRGTFTVGGYKLLFPGEPEGPPEVWINCRCLVVPIGGNEMGARKAAFAVATEEEAPELTDEEIESEDLVDDSTEVPWHGVLTVEGVATGDGRKIAASALAFPEPAHMPAPLMYQQYTSGVPHGESVRVGRIDKMWREESTGEIRATGAFNLNVMEANTAIDGIVFGGAAGVSVDLDSTEMELEFPEGFESMSEDEQIAARPTEVVTSGRLRGATMVGFGAFIEGYIALGAEFDDQPRDPNAAVGGPDTGEDAADSEDSDIEMEVEFESLEELIAWLESDLSDEFFDEVKLGEQYSLVAAAYAPGTHDGPGWLTHPKATQRLHSYWVHGKGAAKIRWGQPGDFNRCRMQLAKYVNPAFLAGTCANLHKEALKVWPGREAGQQKGRDKHELAPMYSLVASATYAGISHTFFEDPQLDGPTALTVDVKTGEVYGHIAAFGTCHIGIADRCVMPPHSTTEYAYFANGVTDTDKGPVRTGPIVMGTGHAGTMASAAKATAHYDNTGWAVADVAVGEDKFGIWFHGKLREGISDADLRAFKASTLSGDWRDAKQVGYPDELVGILTVSTGGFGIPRVAFGMDGSRQVSLLASAGMLPPLESEKSITAAAGFDADDLLMIGRVVADEMEYRAERKVRLSTVRDEELLSLAATRRAERIAAAKSPIE